MGRGAGPSHGGACGRGGAALLLLCRSPWFLPTPTSGKSRLSFHPALLSVTPERFAGEPRCPRAPWLGTLTQRAGAHAASPRHGLRPSGPCAPSSTVAGAAGGRQPSAPRGCAALADPRGSKARRNWSKSGPSATASQGLSVFDD